MLDLKTHKAFLLVDAASNIVQNAVHNLGWGAVEGTLYWNMGCPALFVVNIAFF